MIILSVTVVPFFHRARVYTAYEYLERRFDVRTRSLASFLFLMGRAFSLGVTLAAPAVVMSAILGWRLPVTVLVICVPMILYTSVGGVQAVAWTDVKQMFIVVGGMIAAVVILLLGIPREVSFVHALQLAGATGRLKAIDFRFDLRRDLHLLVGLLGGLFLMLSYFGCDQSQVQRYLTAKSDGRSAQLAADERLREDPAAVAGPGHRRPGVRLLSVPDAADAVQPHLRCADGRRASCGGVRGTRAQFDAAIVDRRQAAERTNAKRSCERCARPRHPRARRALVKDATGDSATPT